MIGTVKEKMTKKGKRTLVLSIIKGNSVEEKQNLINETSFQAEGKHKIVNFDCRTPLQKPTKKFKRAVILDVGGDRFIALRSTLERYPHTRLGKVVCATSIAQILKSCDEFVPGETPEYFFDRNPDNFPSILNMYRTGKFHVTGAGCALVLQMDLDYWGIDPFSLEPCCALKYFPEVDISQNEKDGDKEAKMKAIETATEEDFGSSTLSQWRSWLWNTMEYPWSSKLAQCHAVFSLSMVLLSTITFVVSTIDELQMNEEGYVEYPTVVFIIEMLDNFVVIFFAIEYMIRLVISPRKFKFIKQPMNVIDILAVIPFFISLLLEGLEDFEIIGKTGKIIRLVRVMRIMRLFKLVRHFAGLQSLLITLQQAYQELGILIGLVLVAILTYSSLIYVAEREIPDDLNCTNWKADFPVSQLNEVVHHPCYTWTFIEAFWWGLMTITTVGYDLHPKTMLGKLIGGLCALTGIFILTLPIPIVVNSFAAFYNNRLWRTEVLQKKKERTLQIREELKSGRNRSKFF